MRPEETQALGELAAGAVTGVAAHARELHEGIADRAFNAVGPGGAGVRVAHDTIARGVYAGVEGSLGALLRAGARAASAMTPPDAPSIQQSPAGRIAVGALNGAFGDALRRQRNALALEMTLRRSGNDLDLSRGALSAAFPDATPRLAVFAHGLCQSDDSWWLGQSAHRPYGARLEAELGYTPLFVRYNTGLHVSENGRELDRILDEVYAMWPVPVQEIALIGHSMGGLVARSACHYGASRAWSTKVRHLFTLGTPHRGAPLEQLANATSAALRLAPETRPFASVLNRRSAGIKDLRYGYLVDEDWFGHDCDAFLRRTGHEIPFLESADHYFICATVSRSPDAPLGRIVGDLLVLPSSAWAHGGRGELKRFPIEHYQHVGAVNHFELLNHPAIYEQLRRWISGRSAPPPGAAGDQRP
jgi:pimeloyl-ACP methyl ester carboxylesterase